MALAFGQMKEDTGGSREKLNEHKPQFGDNRIRIFGGIIPRYIYWVTNAEGRTMPVECLSWDRDQQRWANSEKDWVKHYYPDLKSKYGYVMLCVENGEIKIFNPKKTLMDRVIKLAADLGDPTDLDNGWDICYEKEKTGPQPMNVKYNIQELKCSKAQGPVSDEVRALIEGAPDVEEIFARPTPESQKELLERMMGKDTENVDESDAEEFDDDDFDVS